MKKGGPKFELRECAAYFIGVLGILLLAGLLIYLVDFGKPQFEVESLQVSPLIISRNHQITANWSIGMSVKNPSTFHPLVYEKIEVFVLFYNSTEHLANTTVDSFRQGLKNCTKMILQPKALFQGLGDSVGESIAHDLKSTGVVRFNLKFRVDSTYHINLLFTGKKHAIYDVVCSRLKVRFSSPEANGYMVEESKQCFVEGMPKLY